MNEIKQKEVTQENPVVPAPQEVVASPVVQPQPQPEPMYQPSVLPVLPVAPVVPVVPVAPVVQPLPVAQQPIYDEEPTKKIKKKNRSWSEKGFNRKKLKKPNMTAVIFLRENGTADLMEVETKKGFFNIEGHAYHQRNDCTYTISKDRLPLAIIPEWSLIPLGTKMWENKSLYQKFAELQDHVLRGIRHAELVRLGDKEPVSANMKKAIAIGIGAIMVLAIVFQNV